MKIVLQRVKEASVTVDNEVISQINRGYLILLGIGKDDTKEQADKMVDKIRKLRIFEDENGKTNLSAADVDGELLVVSQFTLYADCKKQNRPGFTNAGSPELAQELYEYFLEKSQGLFKAVSGGAFGAHMDVSLINDGPFTIILESE